MYKGVKVLSLVQIETSGRTIELNNHTANTIKGMLSYMNRCVT